tara:strand:+ start:2582 stop:2830 length:249 start_codon:yes stop_codon:yes gene_type:complete
MPSYDFENKETGEIEEHMMSYTKLDQFKIDNPHLKQVILSAPSIDYDGGKSVLDRAGNGWKEVQDRIKSGMPPRERHRIKSK